VTAVANVQEQHSKVFARYSEILGQVLETQQSHGARLNGIDSRLAIIVGSGWSWRRTSGLNGASREESPEAQKRVRLLFRPPVPSVEQRLPPVFHDGFQESAAGARLPTGHPHRRDARHIPEAHG
jgi:hypothetical protein